MKHPGLLGEEGEDRGNAGWVPGEETSGVSIPGWDPGSPLTARV